MTDLKLAPLRWGILGTGNMAATFAEALTLVEGASLAAVASRSGDSARDFADKHGAAAAFGSYNALAAAPDIDAVYVATPHSLHLENALACLNAGKAVLCEKPFTINAAEAETLIAAARAKRCFLMEAMWTRFVPAVVRLRELIADGAIGEPQMMIAGGAYMPDHDPEHYLFRPDLGGGALLDAGVYLVSMASMVFGPAEAVVAAGSIGPYGVDDNDAVLMKFAGGRLASLYVSLRCRRSPDALILGTKGQIALNAPIFCPQRLTLTRHGEASEEIALPVAGRGYHYQIEEVARCIAAGETESAVMPLDETLHIMHALDSARAQYGLVYPMEAQR